MGKGFSRDEMRDLIRRDEGYRDRVYLDTVGVPTLGWGHALHVGSKVPKEVSEIFFEEDYTRAEESAKKLIVEHDAKVNNVRRFIITNMVFNMGYEGVKRFKKMWAALAKKDYTEAANQMLDSKWAKQVARRAIYLSQLMERGKR